MHGFSHMLVVTDATAPDRDAFSQGLVMARERGGRVSVLIVCPSLPDRMAEYRAAYESSVRAQVEEYLDAARSACGVSAGEVPVEIVLDPGDMPGTRAVRHAIRGAYDLLIKQAVPAGHTRGFRALDMELLRKCPCPVMLCRELSHRREGLRVAVAIDPQSHDRSGHDLSILLARAARTLADLGVGDLVVISCWEYPFEGYVRYNAWHSVPTEEVQAIMDHEERSHMAALRSVIAASGISGPTRIEHLRGKPDTGIPAAVERLGVDILVMGTVARIGIAGFFIGNTAENIVHELPCSVLAMKPPGFVSPIKDT